jgi:hypothetical protein
MQGDGPANLLGDDDRIPYHPDRSRRVRDPERNRYPEQAQRTLERWGQPNQT